MRHGGNLDLVETRYAMHVAGAVVVVVLVDVLGVMYLPGGLNREKRHD